METKKFSDEEKRFVLAEAIRNSSISSERLFEILNDGSTVISWDEMLLPHGRNLKQCKDAFETFRPIQAATPYQFQGQSQSQSLPVPSPTIASVGIKRKSPGNLESFSAAPAPKRRQSSDPVTTGRDIRPKPAAPNGSPLSMTSFPTTEPKKRGRPSKKDVERKQAEAMARGDMLAPVTATPLSGYGVQGEEVNMSAYPPILPTPPAVGPGPMYGQSPSTPIEKEAPESTAGSPGKKRRAKATPKASRTTPKQPGESSFSVKPTISQLIAPLEPHPAPPIAPSDTGVVASSIEAVGAAPSGFPVASAEAPPPPTPTTQPPPEI